MLRGLLREHPLLNWGTDACCAGQVSTNGGPPDLANRIDAMGTQVEELWRLNQVYHTFYENLADAINYAYQQWHITAAERDRLVRINKLGDDAKHKGL